MRVKRWITNNIGLKLLSLILAIITWYYVSGELARLKSEEEEAIVSMLHYEVISKKLPVKVTIVGEVRKDCKIEMDGVAVVPESIIVMGPKHILSEVTFARTVPIDITEYTRDVTKQVKLAPIAKGMTIEDVLVNVYIPIVKTGEKASEKPSE